MILTTLSVLCAFNLFVNRQKQDLIISGLKAKETLLIGKMQKSPQKFDPSKININIKCSKASDIIAGMGFNIQNLQPAISSALYVPSQPVIPPRTTEVSKLAQTTQEKNQITQVQKFCREVLESPHFCKAFIV